MALVAMSCCCSTQQAHPAAITAEKSVACQATRCCIVSAPDEGVQVVWRAVLQSCTKTAAGQSVVSTSCECFMHCTLVVHRLWVVIGSKHAFKSTRQQLGCCNRYQLAQGLQFVMWVQQDSLPAAQRRRTPPHDRGPCVSTQTATLMLQKMS